MDKVNVIMVTVFDWLKKNIKYIILVAIIAIGAYAWVSQNLEMRSINKKNKELKEDLLKQDSMKKHQDGLYSKLVNDMKTQKDLYSVLKTENFDLYQIIKKNDEKLLMNTKFTVSMEDKETISNDVVVKVNENRDSTYNYVAKYPNDDNPFIVYEGDVNYKQKIVKSKWKFNPVPVNIVLTEKENGLWNTYVDAPEYFKIDDLTVNSLPKEEIIKVREKKVNIYGGAGYMRIQNEHRPSVNLGISTKGWMVTGGYAGKNAHNITIMKKF